MALHDFTFRDYQKPIVKAMEVDGYRRLMLLLPRRSGKDMCALRIAIRQMLMKTITVYYVFPTFIQARDCIYDGISIDGTRILDFIPDEICTKNASFMKVTFHNGSVLQFIGSDKYNRLRGTNPTGIVFSEFAYQDPRVFDVVSPILTANKGWAIFASTPQGKNHFYDLYEEALKDPDFWYVLKLTVEDTKHIDAPELSRERIRLSDEMFRQEYFCSFDGSVDGSVYGFGMNKMKEDNRIGWVPYDEAHPVYTAWDIGVQEKSDTTTILFFQVINSAIHIIDSYENFRQGAAHYVKHVKDKPYFYGGHALPHDSANFEWGAGLTRIDQLEDLGLSITKVPRIKRKMDGIEKVRASLGRMKIDEKNCKDLLRALNNYHYKWDAKRGRFLDNEPFHDWSSNYSDSLMYVCTGMHLFSDDFTSEDLEEIRISAHTSTLGPRSYGSR